MRTIFYHLVMITFLIYTYIFKIPLLLFKNEKEKQKYSRETARSWGKSVLWASGSEAKVIYVDDSKKQIDEIIEKGEPIIYISNHQSNLDIPVLLGKLPMNFAFIAKKEMKNWPIIGIWMKSLKCIFLDRKNIRQGMKDMKKAINLIESGYSYVIFPEGSRSDGEEIGEFKKGSFKLSIDTGVKIVPITLIGTFNIQRKGNMKIKSNKNVKIIVDSPLNYKELCESDKKNVHFFVREIIKNNFEKYGN